MMSEKQRQVYKAMQDILPKYPKRLRAFELKKLMISEKRHDKLPPSYDSYFKGIAEAHGNEFRREKVKHKVFYSKKNNGKKKRR